MGIFSRNMINESTYVSMESVEACHGDNFVLEGMDIVVENERNYNMLMEAVAINELCCLEESGVELDYLTEAGTGFFAKVKAFFVKVWEKIKGLFKKFMTVIDSFVKSNKEFATKYKSKIMDAETKDFKFKGYNYTIEKFKAIDPTDHTDVEGLNADDPEAVAKAQQANLDNVLEEAKDLESFHDKIRADIFCEAFSGEKHSELTNKELSENVHEVLRDGDKEKTTIDRIDKSEILSVLMKADESTKEIKKEMTKLDKHFNSIIKAMDRAQNALLKAKSGSDKEETANATTIRVYTVLIGATKTGQQACNVILSGLMAAEKERASQCKAIAVRLIARTKTKVNESYDYTNEGGILDRVVFR